MAKRRTAFVREPLPCGLATSRGMQFCHVESKAGGYARINLDFRRGIVEAKVETDIKDRMLIDPEVHARVESVDRCAARSLPTAEKNSTIALAPSMPGIG
jgi:hypothetical protein